MRILILILTMLATPLAADPVADWQRDRSAPVDARDLPRDAFAWVARPVVVFADSPYDPRFTQQMELIEASTDQLAERDVVVIIDTDPTVRSAWREALRPRGFMVAILSKDGGVAARRPTPRDGREITRQIDTMPLRLQEIGARGRGR